MCLWLCSNDVQLYAHNESICLFRFLPPIFLSHHLLCNVGERSLVCFSIVRFFWPNQNERLFFFLLLYKTCVLFDSIGNAAAQCTTFISNWKAMHLCARVCACVCALGKSYMWIHEMKNWRKCVNGCNSLYTTKWNAIYSADAEN